MDKEACSKQSNGHPCWCCQQGGCSGADTEQCFLSLLSTLFSMKEKLCLTTAVLPPAELFAMVVQSNIKNKPKLAGKLRHSSASPWSTEWLYGWDILSAYCSALALKQELFWYVQWCMLCWKQWLLKSGPSALVNWCSWCKEFHFYYIHLSLFLCPAQKKSLMQRTPLHLQYCLYRMARGGRCCLLPYWRC